MYCQNVILLGNVEVKYRGDGRCGTNFAGADGLEAECPPFGVFPCCSEFAHCGVTQEHCNCQNCIDYRRGILILF